MMLGGFAVRSNSLKRCVLPFVLVGFVGCSSSSSNTSALPTAPSGGAVSPQLPRVDARDVPPAVTVGSQNERTPLGVGATLPPFRAAGWINGPVPSAAELAGKVIVIDVWAHW